MSRDSRPSGTRPLSSFKHYGNKFPYRIFKFYRFRLHQRQNLAPQMRNASVGHLRRNLKSIVIFRIDCRVRNAGRRQNAR